MIRPVSVSPASTAAMPGVIMLPLTSSVRKPPSAVPVAPQAISSGDTHFALGAIGIVTAGAGGVALALGATTFGIGAVVLAGALLLLTLMSWSNSQGSKPKRLAGNANGRPGDAAALREPMTSRRPVVEAANASTLAALTRPG